MVKKNKGTRDASVGLLNHCNELFRNFRDKLINIIDKNAPFKKTSRRVRKLGRKLWLSEELLKQIKIENNS